MRAEHEQGARKHSFIIFVVTLDGSLQARSWNVSFRWLQRRVGVQVWRLLKRAIHHDPVALACPLTFPRFS